mgnify:CR=1 FL=1
MDTFIGQLVGFGLIVFAIVKWVVPLVRRMMQTQQELVRQQLEESAAAAKKVAEADIAHARALEEANAEAERIKAEARRDAEKIAEQLRAQADAEVERVKVEGAAQVELLRQQPVRELRQHLGTESVRRAGELVRQHVSDSNAQSATVDRFLDELDAMAPSDAVIENPVTANLRAASRDATNAMIDEFEQRTGGLDADALTRLADELNGVAKLLRREGMLTKYLAEPADDPAAKVRLLESVFSGKIGDASLDILKSGVSHRWSAEADLIEAVQHIARLALLARADRENAADEVEEQLFRFGRILDAEPQLNSLISDRTKPLDGRVALLNKVIEGRVHPVALALLTQTVESLGERRADAAVKELAELAVARRGEIVAHVTAAADLSDAQRNRLAELLSRIYSHPVSIQLHVDPSVLGGLTIAVGDEVIDGSLSTRLAAAETQLPD